MRARGTGSVYRRPESAAWWIKYYGADGRTHRESSGSRHRADAERLLRRRLGEVAQGGRLIGRERERTTFDDLERFIVDDYQLRGRKSRDSLVQSFRALRVAFGGRRACDIGYEDLTHYAAARSAAPATVRRELVLLHRAFVLARRADRVAEIPSFPTIAVDNARRGFFEFESWQSVRAHLAPHLQDVGDFAYWTSWRVMELLSLRWADVDFARGWITLAGRATKNGRARGFPFGDFPELRELLERRRALTGEAQRARERIIPWVFHDEGEPLFGADGRPKRSLRRAWRRACAAGGQPGRFLHDARRSVTLSATGCRALRRWSCPGIERSPSIGATTSCRSAT